MKGLTKKQVTRLFGKPSEVSGQRWYYYMLESCKLGGANANGCAYKEITFDANGRVTAFTTGSTSVNP